jgi:hypothetical protein
MNPVVEAQLKEFIATNSHEQLEQSEFFEVFSIHAIENGLLTENLDPFQVHLKGQEFGIDGVAILIQGDLCTNGDEAAAALASGKNHLVEFHFFQSKTSEKVDYGDMAKFLDAVHGFFTDAHLASSDQVDELVSAKDIIYASALKRNPTIKCFYTTTGSGEQAPPIATLVESSRGRLDQLSQFDEIEILVIGAKDLQAGYRSATNSISATIDFPKNMTLPEHPSVDQGYIGFVSASELLKLITVDGPEQNQHHVNRAVFFDNIRDFDANSDINRSILQDLKEGGNASFVFKNNGVTIVAKEISRTADKFNLDDYQIVNGCQTSNILFLAGDSVKGVSVPLRLIGTKDPEFIGSIIIGTNKQNEVREDQFWALRPFMKDLEEYCRAQPPESAIFIERRENQYREEAVERTRIVKPSELMKVIAAMYLYQPNRAARDYRGIRKEFSEEIFQEGHSVELYHAAAFANYKFEFAVRNGRVDRSWRIYKYYTLYALVRQMWGEPNLLSAPKKRQTEMLSNIRAIIYDEDRFHQHITEVADMLGKLVDDAKLETREQVRDFIRSETFALSFTEARFAKA